MKTNLQRIEQYHAANVAAARIVLSDPERYPKDSFMWTWAQMVLAHEISEKENQ